MKKDINVEQLIVNPENYRFDPVSSQSDAIDLMLKEKGDEIINLARHIYSNGLDRSKDFRVVKESRGGYLVLDGNRRVVALKCLADPSIAHKDNLKNKFEDILDGEGSLPHKVNAFIYDSEEEAAPWIELDHTGKNKGAGLDPWGRKAQERFNQEFGAKKLSFAMQAIDYLSKNGVSIDENKAKITTMNRLLSDPFVRGYLGLDQEKGTLQIIADKDEVLERLGRIFQEVIDRDVIVNDVYYKRDRKEFITEIFDDKPPKTQQISVESEEPPTESSDTSDKPRPTPLPTMRKRLIPKNCKLRIANTRLHKIYRELQNISVSDYENAVAVLFRVFIEGSADVFIDEKSITVKKNPRHTPSLSEKLGVVRDNLPLDSNEKKVVNKAIASKDTILSIDTFNAYVHNNKLHPSSKELRTAWDNFQPIVEKLWGEIK